MPIIKRTRNKTLRRRSYHLIPTPFATGIARMFDVTGSFSSYEYIVTRSDAEALRSDWVAIGGDIRTAMRKYEKEQAK